jgi:hypothetical protein
MPDWYIIVLYDPNEKAMRDTLRFLLKHGDVKAVAFLAVIQDGRILGGLKQKVGRVRAVKGYMPLPVP